MQEMRIIGLTLNSRLKVTLNCLNGNSNFTLQIFGAYFKSFLKYYNKMLFQWIFSEI